MQTVVVYICCIACLCWRVLACHAVICVLVIGPCPPVTAALFFLRRHQLVGLLMW